MSEFSVALRQARKSAGLTQRQADELIGSTEGSFAHWDLGNNLPRERFVSPICLLFGEQLLDIWMNEWSKAHPSSHERSEFGKVLWRARVIAGLNHQQMADFLGISRTGYAGFERNGLPPRKLLTTLNAILSIDLTPHWIQAQEYIGRNSVGARDRLALELFYDRACQDNVIIHKINHDGRTTAEVTLACGHSQKVVIGNSNHIGKWRCLPCSGLTPWTEEEALDWVKNNFLEFQPIAPFPGFSNHWHGTHTVCNRPVKPTLERLRRGEGCCSHCAIEYRAENHIGWAGKPKSGYWGVHFMKPRAGIKSDGGYVARLRQRMGDRGYLGYYRTAEEAAQAYDAKVLELGLDRPLNFPKEES